MARFEDYGSDPEVRDIMERFLKKFPRVFEGFDLDEIGFVVTKKKKTKDGKPINLRTVPYPQYVFSGKTYIVEVMETVWAEMKPKQKNLSVFHTMCAIPVGGFDPGSSAYGKKVKPEIIMYRLEYCATGGVTNWMEDDSATDPMDVKPEDVAAKVQQMDGEEDPIPDTTKTPVTMSDIAGAVEEEVAS